MTKLEKLKYKEVINGPPEEEVYNSSQSSQKLCSPVEPMILKTEEDELKNEYLRLQRQLEDLKSGA